NQVERSSPQARICGALRGQTLVSGQRDGWSLANRPHDGYRVRAESAGCCPADAVRRSFTAIDRVWVKRPVHAHLSGMGSRSSGAMLRVCGRTLASPLFFKQRAGNRSEERRVGKECRSWLLASHKKKIK